MVVRIDDDDADAYATYATLFVWLIFALTDRFTVHQPETLQFFPEPLDQVNINYTHPTFRTDHPLEKIIAVAATLTPDNFPVETETTDLGAPKLFFRPAPRAICVRQQLCVLTLALGRVFPREVLVILAEYCPALVFTKLW